MMPASPSASPSPPRLVLDTNVWLDLLYFDDPRVARLHAALQARQCVAVSDAGCRAEWLRVLGYPALALDTQAQAALVRRYDTLALPFDRDPAPGAAALPRCADPDDQRFLELARDAAAVALLSRDRHLLVLGPRLQRAGMFVVAAPQQFALAADGTPRFDAGASAD